MFSIADKPPSTNNANGDSTDNALVDSCAAALVSLNQRACARDQIRDADKLLHELLFPMSFPWAHPNEPIYKVMPYDLDEMPAILTAGNSKPDYQAHGEFSHLRSSRVPRGTQVAGRRSVDPGVVELTSFFRPTQAQRHLMNAPRRFDLSEDDPGLPGELTLRMYKQVQERKRKRQSMELANKKTKQVSFRFGSTSSRSSIFPDASIEDDSRLLLLPAKFPKILQDGARISGPDVVQRALDLGSYNCRPVPPEALTSKDTSSKNRIFVGRTRLVWSEKEGHRSSSQRVPYRSLLTGDRLDATAAKRPLRIRVAIRLNGALLSSKDPSTKKTAAVLNTALSKDEPFSYGNKVINDALDAVCVDSDTGIGDHSQCSLSGERLLMEASRQLLVHDEAAASSQVTRMRQVILIQRQTADAPTDQVVGQDQLFFVPPWIDCVPTEDGLVSVICTKPGEIDWERLSMESSCDSEHSVSSLIFRELASELECCSICWSFDSVLRHDGSSVKCNTCNVRVHASCLPTKQGDAPWMCQVCDTTKHTLCESECPICKHTGGELVQDKDGRWVHEICKTWCLECTPEDQEAVSSDDATRCHLCAESTGAVARCAAENCTIQFHPMCAITASAASKVHHKEMLKGDAKERDAFLCSQYQLSMVHTSFCGGGSSAAGNSMILPVAFCGYHNPNRQEDFIGLYPGGLSEESGAIRIPSDRTG